MAMAVSWTDAAQFRDQVSAIHSETVFLNKVSPEKVTASFVCTVTF
jgi:hypothetical protein